MIFFIIKKRRRAITAIITIRVKALGKAVENFHNGHTIKMEIPTHMTIRAMTLRNEKIFFLNPPE